MLGFSQTRRSFSEDGLQTKPYDSAPPHDGIYDLPSANTFANISKY
jgi:phage terminase large subunit-like protein